MARTCVIANRILPCQEAFLVDAPTPERSPHRWIQAKAVQHQLDLGCDAVIMHGATPAELEPVVAAYRDLRRDTD